MPAFLVVEATDLASPGVQFSREHPEATLRLFIQVTTEQAHILALGEGDAEQAKGLLEELRSWFPHFQVHERPPGFEAVAWVASFDAPWDLVGPRVRVLARFAREHGLEWVWGRLDQGITYLRLLLPREGDAHELAAKLRTSLEAEGVDADVAVEPESEERVQTWLNALGIATRLANR